MIVFPAYSTPPAPLAGLSPTWDSIVDSITGATITPQPSITELGSGLYKIANGLGTAMSGVIDLGATAFPRYLQLDSNDRYVVAAYSASLAPLAGLSPTWAIFVSVDTGVAITPQPSITELGGGLYRVDYDFDAPAAAGVVDFGVTASPRYFTFTMDYTPSGVAPVLSTLESAQSGIGYSLRTTKARG